MVSSSCSTTNTVFPRLRSSSSALSRRPLSRWCNPIEGSSSTYSTPRSFEPICVPSRIQELQPFDDLVHDPSGNLLLASGQLDGLCLLQRARNRHGGEVCDRHAFHSHCQAFGTQPLAVTRRAFGRRHMLHEPVAIGFRGRFIQRAFQISEYAEKTSLAATLRLT